MLLNKIPCLDKGYVALIDSCGNSLKLKDIAVEFFGSNSWSQLADISYLVLIIRCPLFVHLHLSKFDINIKVVPPKDDVEAYVPSIGEIGAMNLASAQDIARSIEQTTAALLINPKAYQADGCNRFTSQILTPISTYTTVIAHGSYIEWQKLCTQKNLPESIMTYIDAIKQIMTAEWKNV